MEHQRNPNSSATIKNDDETSDADMSSLPSPVPPRAPEISASTNSPIWNATIGAARCSSPEAEPYRVPHLLSPGSPSQSSTSSEVVSIDAAPPTPEPTLHRIDNDNDDGSNYNNDIELGTPVVSFEEDVNNDYGSNTATTTTIPIHTPPPRTKPSLTIKTCDVWEDHSGKKTSSNKARTFHLDTPSTVATTPTSPSDSVYTIEQKHTYRRSKQSKAIAFSKPIIAVAGIVVVALTGGGAYLLSEWFTIPGLTAQIEELQTQVKLLTAQVDRLEEENIKFSQLNDRLEEENTVFASEIVKFNNTNALYAELNLELADITADNIRLNKMLNASNIRYQELNMQLDETTNDLQTQVNALSMENKRLDATVASYAKENLILGDNVDRLESTNEELAFKVQNLNSTAMILTRENNRLSLLNDDLKVIASFLNETTFTLKDSYDDVVAFLARQIDAGRAIWTKTTQNLYRARTNNMVCDIQSRFSGQPFVVDPTAAIGGTHYDEVIAYVEETILTELCIRRDQFEAFLLGESTKVTSSDITLNDLVRSLTRYNMMVFDYYFPRDVSRVDNGKALGTDDWAAANYQCEELPMSKRFVWPGMAPQPKSEHRNGNVFMNDP